MPRADAPLRIYLFDDGLVRFASVKYSNATRNTNNRYMHLTNYSIQKKCAGYKNNSDETICQGHKWGVKALWGYLRQRGINTYAVWDSIKDLIIKTIIASEQFVNPLMKSNVRRRYCCHELFGFDVMLDETLKPWIIEVNISPSLHSNSQLDMNIKGTMVKDLLNLAGFMIPSKSEYKDQNDPNKYIIPSEICLDKRLWPPTCSSDERVKHAYYTQRHSDENVISTILNTLTPEDVRFLVESVDEDSRKGNFERIFPTSNTHRYLRYFATMRYSNLLLDAYWTKYNRMNSRGLALLESLCAKGIHLEHGTDNPKHHWTAPSSNQRVYSAPHSKLGPSKQLPNVRKNKLYNAVVPDGDGGSREVTVTSTGDYDPH